MNRFEHLIHTERREQGELAVDRLKASSGTSPSTSCSGTRSRSRTATAPGGRTCPHFVNTPGYVYAYAVRAAARARRLLGATRRRAPSFVPAYLELLGAGGSKAPEEPRAASSGVDLADPGFWDTGLALVERQLDDAEQAARDAGRLG
jgi:oligoendopeptidase F